MQPLLIISAIVALASVNCQNLGDRAQYEFEYGVASPQTGDVKAQRELRNGQAVIGEYALQESDGTTRLVRYRSSPISGFEAVVQRAGIAFHPPQGLGGQQNGGQQLGGQGFGGQQFGGQQQGGLQLGGQQFGGQQFGGQQFGGQQFGGQQFGGQQQGFGGLFGGFGGQQGGQGFGGQLFGGQQQGGQQLGSLIGPGFGFPRYAAGFGGQQFGPQQFGGQ